MGIPLLKPENPAAEARQREFSFIGEKD